MPDPAPKVNIDAIVAKALAAVGLTTSGAPAPLMMHAQSTMVMPRQDLSMQATRNARRIYVGRIPPTTDSAALREFFEDIVTRAHKPIPGGAVVDVYLNLERRFAFVEMCTVGLAHACMQLDGVKFQGEVLKIRPPNEPAPPSLVENAVRSSFLAIFRSSLQCICSSSLIAFS